MDSQIIIFVDNLVRRFGKLKLLDNDSPNNLMYTFAN